MSVCCLVLTPLYPLYLYQGRMAFYAQSAGEEVLQIASAAALDAEDMVFTQYREPGVLMWRGFELQVG